MVRIHGSVLHGSVLQGSVLHGSVLHGSVLHGSVLHESVLHGSVLHGSYRKQTFQNRLEKLQPLDQNICHKSVYFNSLQLTDASNHIKLDMYNGRYSIFNIFVLSINQLTVNKQFLKECNQTISKPDFVQK